VLYGFEGSGKLVELSATIATSTSEPAVSVMVKSYGQVSWPFRGGKSAIV